jgi:two-component system phosphate regulon sensor histidine kinase PhoR
MLMRFDRASIDTAIVTRQDDQLADGYFKKIAQSVRDNVFVLDKDRQILFANKSAENLFGEGLVGKNFVNVIRHPDCLAAIDGVLDGRPSEGRVIFLERGFRLMLQVNVTDLGKHNDDGARISIQLNDVSQVYEAEQMRTDFVANVSHELRSPLTAVSGFIETLLGPAKDDAEARSRFLNLMQQETARMVRLISDLLSLSKVEANQRIRPTENVDLVSVVRRVVKNLEQAASERGKKIRLDVGDTPQWTIGSEDELIQVFQNLVENSIKYSAAASEIDISICRLDRALQINGPAYQVTVKDKGEGIARHHIARLTERFYRVDNSRSRAMGGTGLGLAIVKHIVGRHRGRLQIESEEGTGSVFRVVLPVSNIGS